MGLLDKLFGSTPFGMLVEHTRKVHECVELLRLLTDALLAEDYERIKDLHHEMSGKEHEADELKNKIRGQLSRMILLSVSRNDLERFLSYQDHVADSAEDYAVVLRLRKTRIHEELKEDFQKFVEQVIKVSEHYVTVAEELSVLAEAAFTGREAERILAAVEEISKEEWQADKLQRVFAQHCYELESEIDPVTLNFYDKYCRVLSDVANSAERCAKFLRQIIL